MNILGVVEFKDVQEVVVEEGKILDESIFQMDKEIKEGDGDVKSEECLFGSKVEGIDKEQKREVWNFEDVEKVFVSKIQERFLGFFGVVFLQDLKV